MAERTGVATKLARVLGGRGARSATDEPAAARRAGATTRKAAPAEATKTTAKKTTEAAAKAPAKSAARTPAKGAAKSTEPKGTVPKSTKATVPKTTVSKATVSKATVPRSATAKAAHASRAAAAKTPAKAVAKAAAAKAPRSRRGGTTTTTTTTKATTRSMTTDTATDTAADQRAHDAEYTDIRAALVDRAAELRAEHDRAMSDINDLQRDRIADGAGDDQADAGTKTFEREQEISLANGILDRLTQVERALDRLDAGTYGRCERCGNPIPKARLEAFPSVTLCVSCKQIEERR
ncbi:MAG TPA: TraR/DksA C4-type zinc finger protein [Mycobacteriales bacterium]|nr:TraR/DksA C4-type zinc finger protein [Mycobacteriales bacterium]